MKHRVQIKQFTFILVYLFTFFQPFFFFPQKSDAQDVGRVRLQVLGGGQVVPFAFNSISKYKNGITYSNYTIFGLTAEDTGAVTNPYAWRLEFQATNAGPNIDGDAGNTILKSSLELTASVFSGFGWGITTNGPLPLTAANQTIAEDNPVLLGQLPTSPADRIAITYDCGTNACPCPPGNALLGSPSDFYSVDVLFTFTVDF